MSFHLLTNRFQWRKSQRLRTSMEFAQSRKGRRFREGPLTLSRTKSNPLDLDFIKFAPIRLGVVIPKKAMRRAHDRNRAKRLIREYVRVHYPKLTKRITGDSQSFSGEIWVVLVGRTDDELHFKQSLTILMENQCPLPPQATRTPSNPPAPTQS